MKQEAQAARRIVFGALCMALSFPMQGAGRIRASALTEAGMFPFVPSFGELASIVDMSSLLVAPAGKNGRIRVKDGHFADDRGRVRLNGVNLVGPANFPSHEQAERMARRLSQLGINCVRLHYFDSWYGSYPWFKVKNEPGIFAKGNVFDPKQRDRQDYLVAQLRRRGVFVDMNLHVARRLDEKDGFPEGSPFMNKGVDLFDPRLMAAEKDYARELLLHVNPYTGLNYVDDPAVAVVEINNENSLFHMHFSGSLDKMGAFYADSLAKLWNDWRRRRRLEGNAPLPRSDQTLPPDQRRAFFEFLLDTERAYWTEMQRFLKDDLGVKVPISGTQLGFSSPIVQSELDYIDDHAYWCHPDATTTRNAPMVNDRWGGCVAMLSARRVAGRPYTVSEYNHPYPNFYGAEGQPMLHAYGALQGWDGVFVHAYNNNVDAELPFTPYPFGIAARTDVLAHLPACAAIFLRGDVREGTVRRVGSLPFERYMANYLEKGSISQGIARSQAGMSPKLGLVHQVAVDIAGLSGSGDCPEETVGNVIVSDTREITWNLEREQRGYWMVDAPNVKFFTGFPDGREIRLGGLALHFGETKLGWATVSMLSREGNGFGENGKFSSVLIAATGLSHNGGARFTEQESDWFRLVSHDGTGRGADDRPMSREISSQAGDAISSRGADWGTGKTVCEGVNAVVAFPVRAARLKAWALDEAGNRKTPLKIEAVGDTSRLRLGPDFKTVWYEVEISGIAM